MTDLQNSSKSVARAWFKVNARSVWRWVIGRRLSGSMVILITFMALIYMNLFSLHKVEWITLVLAIIATSPWLVKMIAINFEELAIGQQGLSIKIRTADELKAGSQNPPLFRDFPINVRRILKTLWHFQQKLFKDDDQKRFGFSSNDHEYQTGLIETIASGLVRVDERWFCYLTDDGLAYCRKFKDEIDQETNFYATFSN
jgi:hypothetical protein